MLPSDLLMFRYRGDEIIPKRLPSNASNQALAQELIDLFMRSQGKSRAEIQTRLLKLESDQVDYRIKRGLSHILSTAYCTFEMIAPVEPADLRQRVFAMSSHNPPSTRSTIATLATVAEQAGSDLGRQVEPEQIHEWLYADLPEHHILTVFDKPSADTLLHRYNLSQAQGVFYRATQVTVNVHRNDPGEYKLMFRYLKLFGLMTYIEGDADHGFTLTIDGPTSLFKASTRYGLAIAKLLPALLHVNRWDLTAFLVPRDAMTPVTRPYRFTLTSNSQLVSHYPPGRPFDSMLEQAFAARWSKTRTDWRLEREVDLIPLPGSVMIPDFRLLHPDGRAFLLEIVGYWRPEYLRKKFSQVRRANRDDVILAVSQRLNLERAGVKLNDLPGRVVWFKDRLLPKSVLEVLEAV